MKIKKTVLTAGILLFSALAAGFCAQGAKVVNRTIATVNGEAILLSEFDKNWDGFMQQQKDLIPPDQMTPQWEQETKGKILSQMVDDKILLQEAKKRKIRVNQRDLENGVVQVKSRFLPENGRRDLDKIVQKAMANRPQDQQQSPLDLGGVDLPAAWQELIKSNPQAIKEAEDKFKDELVKEGINDKKFQDRIRDQLSVVQLTNQEVRSRTNAPSDKDIQALYDKIVRVMQGKAVAAEDAEQKADLESLAKYFAAHTGEQVRARHILIKVAKDASFKEKSAARRKLEDIRAKIVAGAEFADLAEKYSDDKASAVRGGDLGLFSHGQMVAPFEQAAFALQVGQISQVVETDFGFHIIKVEEKKAATKLKIEDVEDDLKEYLYRSKAQNHFEDFVKDLRKSASIKIDAPWDAPRK